jgi:hypothetical protein
VGVVLGVVAIGLADEGTVVVSEGGINNSSGGKISFVLVLV